MRSRYFRDHALINSQGESPFNEAEIQQQIYHASRSVPD
jgi:hypothetical protein